MSNERVSALLDGFEQQVFPAGLEGLNAVYNQWGANGHTMEELGSRVMGYHGNVGMERPLTSDGYRWFWGLEFAIEEGRTAVLFPWARDWQRGGGLQLDRSIAVYICGSIQRDGVENLIFQLQEQFPVGRTRSLRSRG